MFQRTFTPFSQSVHSYLRMCRGEALFMPKPLPAVPGSDHIVCATAAPDRRRSPARTGTDRTGTRTDRYRQPGQQFSERDGATGCRQHAAPTWMPRACVRARCTQNTAKEALGALGLAAYSSASGMVRARAPPAHRHACLQKPISALRTTPSTLE